MVFSMLPILSVSTGLPNNRGFDIFIEEDNVEPLYVTPGKDEIDIKTYSGIEVSDAPWISTLQETRRRGQAI